MASGKNEFGIHLDVGHDSVGWCVTERLPDRERFLAVPGAGVVLFPADDCLASQRREFRRQRRHIRATRQRIARMKALLMSMGVLTAAELDGNLTAAPWKLAAETLSCGRVLTWQELWYVLRWYAHNRGYDGNALATSRSGRVVDNEDRKQNEVANGLMAKYGTQTMAETVCKVLKIDPAGRVIASQVYFKKEKAAFDRKVVVSEVMRILEAHKGKLPGLDERFIGLLMADALKEKGFLFQTQGLPFHVQKRYWGGLLFGQLAPRFDNRIIGRCPVDGGKLPNKSAQEFLSYRWAMMLANVRVGVDMRRLRVDELVAIDQKIAAIGGFTTSEFKKTVRDLTSEDENNLDALLLSPDADKSLVKYPGLFALKKAGVLKVLDAIVADKAVVRKLSNMLFKGKKLSLDDIAAKFGDEKAELIRDLAHSENQSKRRGGKVKSYEVRLKEKFGAEFQSGRAPYSRETMKKAFREVFDGRHPMEEGGVLFRNPIDADPLREPDIDRATNNHLVRHRVKIVLRLIKDIVHDYAGGSPERISQVTVEMARDMKDLSGKKKKEIEGEMLRRAAQHREASEYIVEKLGPSYVSPGLIRKVRIAMDMDWTCPYTGRTYDIAALATKDGSDPGRIDKDHILPRSKRTTDSLDSLVLTFKSVNEKKGNLTGLEFIRKCAGQKVSVAGNDLNAQIVTEEQYKKIVHGLKVFGHADDCKRQKRRKRNLLRPSVDDAGMTDGMLTRTAFITTLAIRAIKGWFAKCEKSPRVVSIPGMVTATLRSQWKLLGILAEIDPRIRGEHGLRVKQEIRGITHMHHAVDAITLGLAATLLPIDGAFYATMCKRRVSDADKRYLNDASHGCFRFTADNKPQLLQIPDWLVHEIRLALAEQRVVVHMPSEKNGLKVEEMIWGVDKVENGRVYIHQRLRNKKTNRIEIKRDDIPISKAFGLNPSNGQGKLKAVKGILQTSNNYGVALLKEPTIVRHHVVWHAMSRMRNGGKVAETIRRGGLIEVANGVYKGLWRVVSVKDAKLGPTLDLIRPYAIDVMDKSSAKRMVQVRSLVKNGLKVLHPRYTGVPCPIMSSISQPKG